MKNRCSNTIWGGLFIVFGIGLIGRTFFEWSFNIFFDGWWTLFIIIPCITGIIREGFNVGKGIGLFIGTMLFMMCRDWIPFHTILKLFTPLVFVLIGLNILFRGSCNRRQRIQMNSTGLSNDYVAVFGAQKVRYPMEKFPGCTANAIFGGVDIDLRDSIIDEDIVIDATAIFGGIDIFVPNNVRVKVSNVPIFGMTSNKTMEPTDINAPTIFVNSVCVFGGVDIK